MSRYYITAMLLFIGGLVLVLYQAVSSLMTAGEIVWQSYTIADFLDMKYLKWIDNLSWDKMQYTFKRATTMPLYILLIGGSVLLFIFGGVLENSRFIRTR